jgi:hypothetical protein
VTEFNEYLRRRFGPRPTAEQIETARQTYEAGAGRPAGSGPLKITGFEPLEQQPAALTIAKVEPLSQPDWFKQNAPATPVSNSGDWFAASAPSKSATIQRPKPARAEDFMEEHPGGGIGGFLSGLWGSVNPLPAIQSFAEMTAEEFNKAKAAASRGDYAGAVLHAINAAPITGAGRVAVNLGKAQWDQVVKAREAFTSGRVSEGAGHALAAITPIVGPAAAGAGEKIGQGQIAEGLGEAAGLVGGIVAPAAVARARGVTVRSPFANPNAVEADAVAFGQARGVPVDAGTATGNQVVRGAQALAEHSIPGSVVGVRGRAAREAALARVGNELADQAYPSPVTPEQAGQGIRDSVLEQVRKEAGQANTAYDRLRKIENDPANRRSVTLKEIDPLDSKESGSGVPRRDGRLAKPGASITELTDAALADARRNGYTGSADDFKVEFYERARQARELGKSMSEGAEYGPAALLGEIRRLGGIRPFDVDYVQGAPKAVMRGEWDSIVGGFKQNHGQSGSSSVFRREGLGVDDLIDQLHQNPAWKQAVPDERALMEVLDDVSRDPKALEGASGDLEHLLRGAGVEAGQPWWSGLKSNTVEMQAPVDLRVVKEALKPIYDELMMRYPVAQQEASAGLKAIANVVNGADYAPLSTADANLGAIKGIARTDLPELRSVSQGTAAEAVKWLESAVQRTADELGPEAAGSLRAGRDATIRKYAAGDVLEQIRTEPVQAFNQATFAKDAGIKLLRDVAKQAPSELPKIGRAFLDDLMAKATSAGGFKQAGQIAATWEKLGPQTKLLLYKDPAYIKDLDRFFLLARKMGESPNPSGSALVGSIAGSAAHMAVSPATGIPLQLAGGAIAKLLQSPRGAKLLSQGFRIPLGNRVAAGVWASQLARFAEQNGIALAPAMADERRQPTAVPITRR